MNPIGRLLRSVSTSPTPRHLSKRFRELGPDASSKLEDVILSQCRWPEIRSGSPALKHLMLERMHIARTGLVPWSDSVRSLEGLHILEVGCGTGPSLVAFAEQGAHVVGLDVSEDMLEVARWRLELDN